MRGLVTRGLVVGSSALGLACGAPCGPEDVAIPLDAKTKARLDARYGSVRLPLSECQKLCAPIGAGGAGGGAPTSSGYSWTSCSLVTIETPGYVGPGVRCEGDYCPPVGIGRRPRGLALPRDRGAGHLAIAAAHEAAAAIAFVDLARDLALHDAPIELVRGAARSAFEEVAHARAMARLALLQGIAIEPVTLVEHATPSLDELARHNAVEGLVFEGFGVDVLHHQSRHASTAGARRAFGVLARDEAGHRRLAARIHAWSSERLGAASRRRIAEASREARERLAREVPLDPRGRAVAGLPDEDTRQRLLAAFDAREGLA